MARRHKKSRNNSKSALGIAIIVLVISLIGGLLGYAWNEQNSKLAYNKDTFCPEAGSPAATAVLIDASDALNSVQKQALMIELKKIQQESIIHENIQVFELSDLKELIQPAFNMCNPGSGANMSYFTENPEMAKKKWQTRFIYPLENVFALASEQSSSPHSKIIEAIQVIAAASFASLDTYVSKKLVIVSDMLQNSPNLSFYEGIPPFASVLQSPFFQKKRTQYLRDVEVTILLLNSEKHARLQQRSNILFWEQFFAEQGASLIRVKRIDG